MAKYKVIMKKLLVILFLTNLISISYANYFDDWSNDNLCGWMDSTSIPEYILEEVDKREIICFGGVEVSALPSSDSDDGKNGTVFPSPDPSLIPETKPDTNSDYSY